MKKHKYILIFYLMVGFIFLLNAMNVNHDYLGSYITILGSYFVMGYVILLLFSKNNVKIFEPAVMVVGLTFITYSIQPMISILSNDMTISGFEVFDSCIESTLIYVVSLLVFLLAYYGSIKDKDIVEHSTVEIVQYENDDRVTQRYETIAFIFTLIGVCVLYYDLVTSGYNLRYILSFGMQGENTDTEGGVGVFINLRYFFIPAFIYLDEYSKKKLTVLLLRILAVAGLYLRGSRWILILLILSPIVYRYTKKKIAPKSKTILIIVCISCLLIGVMQHTRDALHQGTVSGLSWDEFNLLYIWGCFSGNFDMYKTLYAAVNYFPSQHFYTLGNKIFTTVLMVIPHSIWPSRPESISGALYAEWMGQGAVRGHWAYGQMAFFYYEFGIIGCFVGMYLMGRICRKIKKLAYNRPVQVYGIVIYSVMYPMLMQLIIRGDIAISLWPVFFMFLMIWITEIFARRVE